MDIVLVFLLNTLVFTLAFIILSRRFDRQYSSRQFLSTVESEVQRIMASFNQTADENIRILEDRIETLNNLKREVGLLLERLETVKNAPISTSGGDVVVLAPPLPSPVVVNLPQGTVPEGQDPIQPEASDPRAMVMVLHRQGIESAVIAQRTGIPLGETELIIRLHGGL